MTEEDEPELEMSPLCQTISKDGFTIDVQIYRFVGGDEWALEVVDEDDGSTVWDSLFKTDEEALAEVIRIIEKEGIASFLRDPSEKIH